MFAPTSLRDVDPQRGWLSDLNDRQRHAAEHTGSPLLVVAGAGSGKTRTLAARVAVLIEGGVQPERILLLTFTRRAAREMLARADAMTGNGIAARVWGGTFHGVAHRILRQHGRVVGLTDGFTVLDQGDAADLIGIIRSELGLGERELRFPKKETIGDLYSRMVNGQDPLEKVVDARFPWCRRHVADLRRVLGTFVERKRLHNLVDYDDLLLYWRALLEADRPTTPGRFSHVLVDEYQDTNAIQADILHALYGEGSELTVVGDDAQAIYGFRAATADNLHGFLDRFPGTTVVSLEQNYRSTPEILEAANAVMEPSPVAFPKELWSTRPSGPRPLLVACHDEAEQAGYVCDRVLALREEGVALREQAVLVRAAHHSAGLEVELARRDIPFAKFGGLKFLEAAHVKDVMALLRLLDNDADVLAWHRVLRLLDGVGPATIRTMLSELRIQEGSHGGALRRFVDENLPLPKRSEAMAQELRAAYRSCLAGGADSPAMDIEHLGAFCATVFERRYERPAARLADLEQLQAMASTAGSRASFLAELTLDPPNATSDLAGPPHLDDDYLIVSTIHSAKGGEWHAVYLLHASDGNLPSDMALSEPDGLEEERRLLYVALTRAKQELIVSYPMRFHLRRFGGDGAHVYGQPSRFLRATGGAIETVSARSSEPVRPEPSPAGRDPVVGLIADLLG